MPKFDIFQGLHPDKDAVWVEAVEGLPAARKRMEEIASNTPGPYFVFSNLGHLVLATVDTSEQTRDAGAA